MCRDLEHEHRYNVMAAINNISKNMGPKETSLETLTRAATLLDNVFDTAECLGEDAQLLKSLEFSTECDSVLPVLECLSCMIGVTNQV